MKLKYLLIAAEENNYRPWILTKTSMACFCITIWAVRLLLPQTFSFASPTVDPKDLLDRVNFERTQRFLPSLIPNDKLTIAADIKSQDMIDQSYFAHVNPDGDYVWPVIEAQGYKPYQSLGENLAMDFVSAEAVVSAWMNSPGHRANILNDKFEDTGMAAITGNYTPTHESVLITNLFGTLFKTSTSVAQNKPEVAQSTASKPEPETVQPEEPAPAPITAAEPPAIQTHLSQTASTPTNQAPQIDTGFYTFIKIFFALIALIYAFFLVIDSIILHRAKIQRENIPSATHAILFALISLINVGTLWL